MNSEAMVVVEVAVTVERKHGNLPLRERMFPLSYNLRVRVNTRGRREMFDGVRGGGSRTERSHQRLPDNAESAFPFSPFSLPLLFSSLLSFDIFRAKYKNRGIFNQPARNGDRVQLRSVAGRGGGVERIEFTR